MFDSEIAPLRSFYAKIVMGYSQGVPSMTAEGTDADPREHFLRVANILILQLHAACFPGSEYAEDMGEML